VIGSKGTYYGMIIVAAAVFLFSILRLASYTIDARQSNKQLKEARELYQADSAAGEFEQIQIQKSFPIESPYPYARQEVPSIQHNVTLNDPQNILQVQDRFKPLLEVNSDVIGWIKIEDTVIDYPVVQGEDNEYYLTRDLKQQNNVNGSIFMDYRNQVDSEEQHWIVYGHNMKNKTMFMALLNYESKWYFDHHSFIEFDTLYANKKWKVFSAYFTNTKDDYIRTDFASDQEYREFLAVLQNKSLHKTELSLTEADQILTLSTCSNTNDEARFVVHAKLLR